MEHKRLQLIIVGCANEPRTQPRTSVQRVVVQQLLRATSLNISDEQEKQALVVSNLEIN
jgi:hypothetical protein